MSKKIEKATSEFLKEFQAYSEIAIKTSVANAEKGAPVDISRVMEGIGIMSKGIADILEGVILWRYPKDGPFDDWIS